LGGEREPRGTSADDQDVDRATSGCAASHCHGVLAKTGMETYECRYRPGVNRDSVGTP
jgi:hypothetical protein